MQVSSTELPETMFIKRNSARLRAAISAAVGAPAIVHPRLPGAADSGSDGSSKGGAAAASPAPAAGGSPTAQLAFRPSMDAASDSSSALRSSQSEASGAARCALQ